MLFVNLALAIAPGLLLLAWAYRRDSGQAEPRRLVMRSFFLGFLAVALALGLGLLTRFGDTLFRGYGLIAYRAFFTAGFLEEGAKFLVVMLLVARREEFDEIADGIVYTMAASLGFAVLENVLYLGGSPGTLFVRAFTAVPMHGSVGGLMGYFIGLHAIEGRGSPITGLLLAVAVHGLYDFVLFTGTVWSFLAIPIVIAAMVVVGYLFRVSVARDRKMGRVPPERPSPPLTR